MTIPSNSEYVEYDLRIQAREAIMQLQEASASASTFSERIHAAQVAVEQFSEKTGLSLKSTKTLFQETDKILSDTGKDSAIFGEQGKVGWSGVATGAERATSSINVLRTALHLLVVTLLFEVFNAFRSVFEGAINGLRELEGATYNLVGAERVLSQQGIGITPQDLDGIISRLQKLDPMLSKIQASELVSRTARNIAPQVGFDTKQIEQFTQAVAILAIQNKNLGYSFEEVESQISNAFLTGKVSQGINKLGVKITDQIVRDEALRLQLVKTADEFDHLTGKIQARIKAQALLSVLVQATDPARAHLPDYFKTADASFSIFQARLSDVLTKFGTLLAPTLIKVFQMLTGGLQSLLDWMDKNSAALTLWGAILEATVEVVGKGIGLILKFGTVFGMFATSISKAGDKLQAFIDKYPRLKKLLELWGFQGIGSAPDTPTVPEQANPESINTKAIQDSGKKLADIYQENKDKLLDIETKYQEKLQDLARKNAEKLDDITRNDARKREDALSDLNKKIGDINTNINQKEVDAKKDAHRKEIDEEQKYQQALKELQQKYLMDLEDALHNRDAKQILHLMRQYAFDKQNLADKHKQDQQAAKVELAQKLQDLEIERKQKIAAAQKEYADKLKELDLALQRERQDARIAHQRDLADARIAHERDLAEQRLYLQRKLRDLATALMQEYNLTKTMVEAIFKLWAAKYGTSLPSFSISSPTPTTSTTAGSFSSFAATQAAVTGGMGFGLANGGSFLATTPTKINVAESGPELVSATPLGRIGSDLNKLFMQAGGARGDGAPGGGQFELGVTLSPDLETRIIKKSLDETANVLMRVNRGKV